jgi:GTP-binding protein
MNGLPIVALVGRPNVGKSTLFNRLVGRPQAIVENVPGTTRDRNYGVAVWNDKSFMVVDTGGLDYATGTDMARDIRRQAAMAIEEADVIVFMVDARSGMTAMDHDVADQLRASRQQVVLAASKADNTVRQLDATEFYVLGFGEPIAISGLNGLNTGDLLDRVTEHLPKVDEPEPDQTPRITLVGRPNVGKSSLLNAILQEDRALVSSIPGTTRDTTDTGVSHNGRPLILVDTAGIRKRGHIDGGVERYSVMRAMRAISRSDVAVLVIDATEPLAAQDAHIAGYVWEAGRGLIVVINKWDLVVPKDDHTMAEFTRRIQRELQFVHDVPLLFTSALTRQRVRRILDLSLEVKDLRSRRVPTGELNKSMQEALQRHQTMSHSGKMLKLRYATQVATDPPTFVFFVNDPEIVHFSYRRFLENQLREQFSFTGTAIRLIFRSSREAPEEVFARPKMGGVRKAPVVAQRVPARGPAVSRGERGSRTGRPAAPTKARKASKRGH